MNEPHLRPLAHTPMPVWRFAWRIFRLLPGRYCALLALVLSGWLLTLPLGIVPSHFFDALTGAQPAAFGIWGSVGLLAVCEILRSLANFGWGVVGLGTEYQVRAVLQRNVLQHMLDVPTARALPFSAGEAINRLRDDIDAGAYLLSAWFSWCGACLFGLVGLVLMARVSISITLLVFLPLVVILLVTNRLRVRIEAYRAHSRQTTADTAGTIGEVFRVVQAIKVARAEARVVEHVADVSVRRQHAALREIRFSALLDAVFGSTTELGTSLILLVAALEMRAGTFTVGSFVLFVFFLDTVPGVIGEVGALVPQYRQTGVAFRRLQELLQGAHPQRLVQPQPSLVHAAATPVVDHLPPVLDPLRTLDVRNLSYTYTNSDHGIRDISFRLERGQCLVITGRIGSGKTTLVRTLLGLLPKESGQIYWNDRDIETPATFFVPPHSAYTAQVPTLFSETLRDNIILGLGEQTVDLPAALHSAVLDQAPIDLDTMLGPRGMRLSGGQAQRTAAARMFVRRCELLVLDDLSSALDIDTEHHLWERLCVAGHPTLVIVSHRREVLRRANHILVLRDGAMAAYGTLAELVAENEEVQAIWYSTQTGDPSPIV